MFSVFIFLENITAWTGIPIGPAVEIFPESSKQVKSYSWAASSLPALTLAREAEGVPQSSQLLPSTFV